MESLIRCENLVKIFKVADLEVVALQGLDLQVQSGELMGIVGASGSSSMDAVHSTVSCTHFSDTQPPVKRDMAMPSRP